MAEPANMWLDFAKISFGCLLGLAGSLVAPFCHQWLGRCFLGPKLIPGLDADEVPTELGNQTAPALYFRVRVQNDGANIARGCRCYLTRIQAVENDRTFKTIFSETFQLTWSYDGKRDSLDLPRGPTPTVDVVRFQHGGATFLPCLRSSEGSTLTPNKFDSIFVAHGTHRFSVLITGDETSPKTIEFDVTYNPQNWPPTGEVV